MTNREILTKLNATTGSLLSGTDEDGTDIIEILGFEKCGVGQERLMAKCIKKNGKVFRGSPCNWGLNMRDWVLVVN